MVQKSKGREHWPRVKPWQAAVKEFTHRKNRQATRRHLHHGQYDQIPKDNPVHTEDEWNWD